MFYPCPKCQRPLEQSGVAVVDGAEFPVYQCEQCIIVVPVWGEVALTFAVDEHGKPFDPVDKD